MEIAIENLKKHHLIKIADGSYKYLKLLVYNFLKPENAKHLIKKIPKDLFKPGYPNRDLYLSNTHGLLFDDTDFNRYKNTKYTNYEIYISGFKKLCTHHVDGYRKISDCDIEKIINENDTVSYYHIILDDINNNEKHGIFANGVLCESFRYNDLKHCNLNIMR